MSHARHVLVGLVLGLGALLLLGPVAGCGSGGGSSSSSDCATYAPGAVIDVSGTWDYVGTQLAYFLRGDIVFSQSGNMVTVTQTTYDNAFDRELESQPAALSGNRLDVVLTPINGDPDYSADVTFLFGDNGTTFCVSFTDTNADQGALGSYIGTIQGP